jgi:hypothetical protein
MADLAMIPFAIGMVAVAAFVLVAAAMLRLGIRAFRASRHHQLQTQRVVTSLGFTAVEDPAWAETLSAHFWEPPTNRPYVCGLAKRPGPGYTAWMFRPNVRASAGGGNRTRTALRPWDFKSHASASFATPAP